MSVEPPLPLDEARARILDAVEPLQPIELPLAEAYGCVAAADVTAEFDLPPFSASSVDGLAARSADIGAATPETPVALRVAGWAMVGRPPEVTVGWGEGVRVATGAPVPAGADCVLAAGAFEVEGEAVRVLRPAPSGANIRPAGEDLRAGASLVPAGRRISAAELGVLAASGHGSTLAYPRLRIGVATIGDLIEPGRPAAFGEVRDASSYLLLGALREVGALPYRIGVVRDIEGLRDAIASNTLRADAFVVSGGGTPAEIAGALVRLGDIQTFSAALHPGGQVAYGLVEGKPFFHLPPGATSTFVAFEVFVRPAVLRMMGRRDLARPEIPAILDGPVRGPAGLALCVPVRVSSRDGSWRCTPTGPAATDRLGAIAQANGLVLVPPGDREAGAGEQVRVQVFRPLDR